MQQIQKFFFIFFLALFLFPDSVSAAQSHIDDAQTILGQVQDLEQIVNQAISDAANFVDSSPDVAFELLDQAANRVGAMGPLLDDVDSILAEMVGQGSPISDGYGQVEAIRNQINGIWQGSIAAESAARQAAFAITNPPTDDPPVDAGDAGTNFPSQSGGSVSSDPCAGIPNTISRGGICLPTSENLGIQDDPVQNILLSITLFVTGLIGVLAVLMIVISGVMYMLSAGDTARAETAKKILTYAIIGLIVALLAWVIVSVVSRVTGAGGLEAGGANDPVTGTQVQFCDNNGICFNIENTQ